MSTKLHNGNRAAAVWGAMREAEAAVADELSGRRPHSRRIDAIESAIWRALPLGHRRRSCRIDWPELGGAA